MVVFPIGLSVILHFTVVLQDLDAGFFAIEGRHVNVEDDHAEIVDWVGSDHFNCDPPIHTLDNLVEVWLESVAVDLE